MAAGPIKNLHLPADAIRKTGKTLGKGAYGEVVEVVYLGTPCAAKRIHPILEDSGSHPEEGFRREYETWSQLRHPNVVQLLGLLYKPSVSSKLPMIVMEKMDCSLRQFVETNRRGAIPFSVKVDVLYQVAQGLAYLHGQRPPVVHRDLSPNNILINLGSMTAKLSDFGVAKFQIHQASRMTSLPGTPAFMPPETLPGAQPPKKGYSDRIDVFSYGGVVICTVTHMWPEPVPSVVQKGGTLVALNEMERRQKYLSHFTAEEKRYFLDLAQRCLEFEPVDRPTSQEILGTLKNVKGTHPGQSYVHLLQSLETVTESNREAAKLLQKKTEEMEAVQQESAKLSRMLQGEAARLSSERDVALTKLKETEETVFILQQTVESLQCRIEEQEFELKRIRKEQRLEHVHTQKEPPQEYHMLRVKKSLSTSDVKDTVSAPPDGQKHDETYPEGCEVDQVPPLEDDDGSIRSGSSQVSYDTRHVLPKAQAITKKYHQQPLQSKQPSAQLQPKAQTTTKRAANALPILDPNTNKPVDLVNISTSSKSKPPEPASVTSLTQDAKREEFMAKISGKSNTLEDTSQTGPSSSNQLDMSLLADSTSSKKLSRVPAAPVQPQVIAASEQQQHRFPPVAQMNQLFPGQTPPVFYQAAGAGLMPQGQPMFHPAYPMVHQGMVIGAGAQHRQQGMMFPHQQLTSTACLQPSYGARHDLSTTQAPTQKYPQQPQQPSTQLQPKAQTTTKRATKALLIVDPDTNKPLDHRRPQQPQMLLTQQRLTTGSTLKHSAATMANKTHQDELTSRTEEETCNTDRQSCRPMREVYVYDRDYLLSLRFLKECLEPPKDLFFPGAIDLVRRTKGDVADPKRGRRYP